MQDQTETADEPECEPTWPTKPADAPPEWGIENNHRATRENVMYRKREALTRQTSALRETEPTVFIRDVRTDTVHAFIDHTGTTVQTVPVDGWWRERRHTDSTTPLVDNTPWDTFYTYFMETPLRVGDSLSTFESTYDIVGYRRTNGILNVELRDIADDTDREWYAYRIHRAIRTGEITVHNSDSFYNQWSEHTITGPTAYYNALTEMSRYAMRLARTDDAAPDPETVITDLRRRLDAMDVLLPDAIEHVEAEVRANVI